MNGSPLRDGPHDRARDTDDDARDRAGTADAAPGGPVAAAADGAVTDGTAAQGAPAGGIATGGTVAGPARLTAWVRGRVQGVGFRWWTRATALEIGGLAGFVANLEDGRVQVVAEGDRARCERLLEWLRHGATPGRVDGVTEIWGAPRGGYPGFLSR